MVAGARSENRTEEIASTLYMPSNLNDARLAVATQKVLVYDFITATFKLFSAFFSPLKIRSSTIFFLFSISSDKH